MQNIPIWIHTIWLQKNKPLVCKTLYRDGEALQDLVDQYGPQTVQFAWAMYVTEEPSCYHLEPVKVAVKATSKKGNEWVDMGEDEAAITRFPLAAFLKVSDAYISNAMIATAEIKAWQKEHRGQNYHGMYDAAFYAWSNGKQAAAETSNS